MSVKTDKKLLIISGATGVGKTDFAIKLANHLKTEIVSSDSRQIYKELNIGVAKPSAEELSAAKHHLIGYVGIEDYYNVFHFEQQALEKIEEVFTKSDFAILAGGSGMYIDVVCNGIDDIPDPETEIREKLKLRIKEEGLESLRFDLKMLDPEFYEIADLRNPKRILRALEVCLSTGKKYSSFRKSKKANRDFEIVKIWLNREREELYDRINQRVDKMLEMGLLEEAKSLRKFKNLNSLNTVGYKELFDYFEGNSDFETAIELIKRNSRRYAKRQISWMKRDGNYNIFDINKPEMIFEFIENYFKRFYNS